MRIVWTVEQGLVIALVAVALASCGGPEAPAERPRTTGPSGGPPRFAAEIRPGAVAASDRPRPACDVNTTPDGFADAVASAGGGARVCLAPGDYGTYTGTRRPDRVTIAAEPGAEVRMRLEFRDATNLTLDGLRLDGAELTRDTRDITIANSVFTAHVRVDGVTDANILFDRDAFLDIDAPGDTVPARLSLPYTQPEHSGVTVRNSLFAGGDADGVQSGTGIDILDNEFRDILEDGPNHTDAIQLIAAKGSRVSGNFIRDSATGIVAYGGLEEAVIEHNVIDLTGKGQRPWGVELVEDRGSIVRHNTVVHAPTCAYDTPCGMIDVSGTGTTVVDNVATQILASKGAETSRREHNLVQQGEAAGDVVGLPRYAGGASPGEYAGFRLTRDSPGHAAGSDGTDIGIGG